MFLLIQDPNDNIVDNSASMKAGIATKLLLNDSSWMPKRQLRVYSIAVALNDCLPHRNIDSSTSVTSFKLYNERSTSTHPGLSTATSYSTQQCKATSNIGVQYQNTIPIPPRQPSFVNRNIPVVSEEFIHHFYACILHISRCANHIMSEKKKQRNEYMKLSNSSLNLSNISNVSISNVKNVLSNNTVLQRRSSPPTDDDIKINNDDYYPAAYDDDYISKSLIICSLIP